MLIEFTCSAIAVDDEGYEISDQKILKSLGTLCDDEAELSDHLDHPLDKLGLIDAGVHIFFENGGLKAVFRFRAIERLSDDEMRLLTDYVIGQILDGYGEGGFSVSDNNHIAHINFVMGRLYNRTIKSTQVDDGVPVPDLRPSPLLYAAETGDLEAIKKAIKDGENLAPKNRWGMTPLMIAVRERHDKLVFALLDAGVDAAYTNLETHSSAIKYSAMVGGLEVMRALLNAGAEVNPKHNNIPVKHTHDDATPLMWAANRGHRDLIQLLLQHGADVNQQTETGETALMYCQHPEIIHDLVAAGANISLVNNQGMTALDNAREQLEWYRRVENEELDHPWEDIVEALEAYASKAL